MMLFSKCRFKASGENWSNLGKTGGLNKTKRAYKHARIRILLVFPEIPIQC